MSVKKQQFHSALSSSGRNRRRLWLACFEAAATRRNSAAEKFVLSFSLRVTGFGLERRTRKLVGPTLAFFGMEHGSSPQVEVRRT